MFVKAWNLQKHTMNEMLYTISQYCLLPAVLSALHSMQLVQSEEKKKKVEHKHSKTALIKIS